MSVFINGKALACVTSTCYLGVIKDQHLSWKLHVNYVLKGIRCKLYVCFAPSEAIARSFVVSIIPSFYSTYLHLFTVLFGHLPLYYFQSPLNVYILVFYKVSLHVVLMLN